MGPRVRKHIAILAVSYVLAASAASGQFIENGGQAGSADTTAFGQAAEFSNVTTQFDGVEFQLQRLLRDPKDNSKLKLIGQFVNLGEDDRWLYLFYPFPSITDELGNVYVIELWTGVDACRDRKKEDYDWYRDVIRCGQGDGPATRLAPNLPVTAMLSFVPSDTGEFDGDLASLSTFVNLSMNVSVSTKNPEGMFGDDLAAVLSPHAIMIPQIPMPAP